MPFFDVVIVGQGLAGTLLAWHLIWKGQQVCVIDRCESVTSSRIAAGLVTPITGQRFVKTWNWEVVYPAACDFYQRVEEIVGKVFHTVPMVRLFANANEQIEFQDRRARLFPDLVTEPDELVQENDFAFPFGGFEMKQAGRLEVSRFLDMSRAEFKNRGTFHECQFDVIEDVDLSGENVRLPRLEIEARKLVFCEGHAGANNKLFPQVRFNSAKGEILTVRIPGFHEHRVIHRGLWIAPIEQDLYRVGSTYTRDVLDNCPTESGRNELCAQLQQFLRKPFDVIDHHAAIRPIVRDCMPLIGLHTQDPRLGIFNGLGSKGVLQGPYLAKQLAAHIVDGVAIPPEVSIERVARRKWK